MRATFHTELDELTTDLTRMTRLTAHMITTASSGCTAVISHSPKWSSPAMTR
jgi:hypothetical protein